MAERTLIIQSFEKTNSYASTGREFGLSRQRVHQIITRYDTIKPVKKKVLWGWGTSKLVRQLRKSDCINCGKKSRAIHHYDGNPKNNTADNLFPVCRKCHGLFHRGLKHKSLYRYKVCNGWCGKRLGIDIPLYSARGYCSGCYQAKREGRTRKQTPTICTECGRDRNKGEIKGYLLKGLCIRDYQKKYHYGSYKLGTRQSKRFMI